MDLLTTFAQSASNTSAAAGLMVWMFLFIAVAAVAIIATWKVFTKAGQPGWASLIPIYNTYILLKIVGKPGWWLLLYLIPLVSIIISLIVAMDLAKAFGKSEMFGVVGVWLFSFIGYSILAFGEATYTAPVSEAQ